VKVLFVLSGFVIAMLNRGTKAPSWLSVFSGPFITDYTRLWSSIDITVLADLTGEWVNAAISTTTNGLCVSTHYWLGSAILQLIPWSLGLLMTTSRRDDCDYCDCDFEAMLLTKDFPRLRVKQLRDRSVPALLQCTSSTRFELVGCDILLVSKLKLGNHVSGRHLVSSWSEGAKHWWRAQIGQFLRIDIHLQRIIHFEPEGVTMKAIVQE